MSDEKKYSLQEVLSFLLGEGELEGHSFGEVPEWGTQYWWRRYLRKALSQPAAVEGWSIEKCKGYALLGSGQYIISHTRDFHPELGAELIITLATEEEKNRRTVGDIHPEQMVIRIGFISERGLFALEQQLQIIRDNFFAPTLPRSEDARGAEPVRVYTNTHRELTLKDRQFSHEGNGYIQDNNFDFDAGLRISGDFVDDEKERYAQMIVEALNAASGLLSEKVEPVGKLVDSGFRQIEWFNKPTVDSLLYTLPPTAQQALRMAADVCTEHMNGALASNSQDVVVSIRARILALLPPTDPYQQARAEGFAEGVKVARNACRERAANHASEIREDEADQCAAAIDALSLPTPSQDTVMMAREELEEFGKDCAREALFQASNGVNNDADYNLSAIVAQHMPKESE